MKRKEIIVIVIGILIGVMIQFTDPFTTVALIFYVGISSLFSIGLLISSIFLGKESFKWALITSTPFLFLFVITSVIRDYKHKKAVVITSHLENFKKRNGHYPGTLSNASEITLSGLTYEAINNLEDYKIEYFMDGFNREYFDSESNEWGTKGWND